MKHFLFNLTFVLVCSALAFIVGYEVAASESCFDAGECALQEPVRGVQYGAIALVSSLGLVLVVELIVRPLRRLSSSRHTSPAP